jgi:hypothetical protein
MQKIRQSNIRLVHDGQQRRVIEGSKASKKAEYSERNANIIGVTRIRQISVQKRLIEFRMLIQIRHYPVMAGMVFLNFSCGQQAVDAKFQFLHIRARLQADFLPEEQGSTPTNPATMLSVVNRVSAISQI